MPEGARQIVTAEMPEGFAGLAVPDDGVEVRGTRFLALSGKSDKALRELAGRYLGWLEQGLADGDASGSGLADMAWTAGTGRSHFLHRAGVPFRDAGELREGLRALVEADEVSEEWQPRVAGKAAFVYAGEGGRWTGMDEGLYRREPVARAVLDRCDEVFRLERGTSLLDGMFGRNGRVGESDDGEFRAAVYAMECALTALWGSVGVRPSVVAGYGVGELAAAQAAGMVSLEDGLRLALAGSGGGQAPDAGFGSAPVVVISGATGNVVETMAGLGVDVVVQVGLDGGLGQTVESGWPGASDGGDSGGLGGVVRHWVCGGGCAGI